MDFLSEQRIPAIDCDPAQLKYLEKELDQCPLFDLVNDRMSECMSSGLKCVRNSKT